MKFLSFSESTLFIKEILEPKLKKGEILVKVDACGICGSDIGNIFGKSCKPTSRLGHEIVGTIEKMKINSDKNIIQCGTRVFVHHHASCSKCYYCLHGNETLCENFVDSIYPCGISEKIVIPQWIINTNSIFKLPDNLSPEEGIMIEPLACCLRGWNKIKLVKGDTIVIFGIGPIGMINAILGKMYGASKIFCIDINEYRLGYCETFDIGIPLDSRKSNIINTFNLCTNEYVDLIIVATSDFSVLKDAVKIIRPGGIILIFGEPQMGKKIDLSLSELYTKEISFITTYAASNKEIKQAIELVDKKIIDVKKLVSHKFTLEESSKAIDRLYRKKDTLKVMINNSKN
ncbi:MAG: alcohol dehydrogenase catalytic domain-containing protein [Nitrososphaeraceae archaeon]